MTCPSAPTGYTLRVNMDQQQNDIRQVTTGGVPFNVGDVAAACSVDPNCKGFNNYGWMKSLLNYVIVTNGACFYTKSAHKG